MTSMAIRWRKVSGKPTASREPIAQQEDEVRKLHETNSSISSLLDLFGPAGKMDLIHSAKENWRREWDSITSTTAISLAFSSIATNIFYYNALHQIAPVSQRLHTLLL